jgi:hypothetical protein
MVYNPLVVTGGFDESDTETVKLIDPEVAGMPLTVPSDAIVNSKGRPVAE